MIYRQLSQCWQNADESALQNTPHTRAHEGHVSRARQQGRGRNSTERPTPTAHVHAPQAASLHKPQQRFAAETVGAVERRRTCVPCHAQVTQRSQPPGAKSRPAAPSLRSGTTRTNSKCRVQGGTDPSTLLCNDPMVTQPDCRPKYMLEKHSRQPMAQPTTTLRVVIIASQLPRHWLTAPAVTTAVEEARWGG